MAVKISPEIQSFLNGKLAWVATADTTGQPNVTPKGSIKCLDDQTLMFADLFNSATVANLKQNAKVAVTVADPAKFSGYQLKGRAELVTQGPLYDAVKAELKKAPMPLPEPSCVVKITVEGIYDIAPGPNAGHKVA